MSERWRGGRRSWLVRPATVASVQNAKCAGSTLTLRGNLFQNKSIAKKGISPSLVVRANASACGRAARMFCGRAEQCRSIDSDRRTMQATQVGDTHTQAWFTFDKDE